MKLACIAMVFGIFSCGNNKDVISVITREDGSGTRGAFVEIVGLDANGSDNTSLDAIVHDGTGKVMTAVQNDESAIGYISLGSLNDLVKGISVEGVVPTVENIQNESYKIARPFNVAYSKDLKPLGQDFLKFVMSDDGQKIAEASGFVPTYRNELYKTRNESGTLTIGGSTSVFPLMEKMAEKYQQANPMVKINIEAIGSSAGIKGAISGLFDIGMASRELKDSEKAQIEHSVIARDGIAIIVNKNNPLANLTIEEIREVYLGNTTKFSELNK